MVRLLSLSLEASIPQQDESTPQKIAPFLVAARGMDRSLPTASSYRRMVNLVPGLPASSSGSAATVPIVWLAGLAALLCHRLFDHGAHQSILRFPTRSVGGWPDCWCVGLYPFRRLGCLF